MREQLLWSRWVRVLISEERSAAVRREGCNEWVIEIHHWLGCFCWLLLMDRRVGWFAVPIAWEQCSVVVLQASE